MEMGFKAQALPLKFRFNSKKDKRISTRFFILSSFKIQITYFDLFNVFRESF